MGPRTGARNTTPEIIANIMRKHGEGLKVAQIARDLYLAYSTVFKIIKRNGVRSKSTGRPRKISPKTERLIMREWNKDPRVYAHELASIVEPIVAVTPRTIRNVLRRNGVGIRVARKAPLLTEKHKRARLKFARKYARAPPEFWEKVLWSDESKIVSFNQRCKRVWRRPGTAHHQNNINGAVKHSQFSLMVWGCCSSNGVGPLVKIDSRMTATVHIDILKKSLGRAKRMSYLPQGFIFMQRPQA